MGKLRDVVAYFCVNYPHKDELSKARLTKMVFLADWRAAILHGKQITDVEWEFNHYGPYVNDAIDVIRNDPSFTIEQTQNMHGNPKEIIRVAPDIEFLSLTKEDISVLDHVIETTAPKYWNDFIRLVYSTYPLVTQEKYTHLNLPKLAKQYNKKAHLLESN